MAKIDIRDYRIRKDKLYIETESKIVGELESVNFILVDRKTKESNKYIAEVKKEDTISTIILNLDKVEFVGDKNIIDIDVEIGSKRYKLYKNIADIKNTFNRYSQEYYSVNDIQVIVPYLTLKNELSILCGNKSNIFRSYCEVIQGKVAVNNITVRDTTILFSLNNFDIGKFSAVSVVVVDRKTKKIEELNYICDLTSNTIAIDVKQITNLNLEQLYDIRIEVKIGNIIKSLQAGLETVINEDKIFNEAITIDELSKVLLHRTSKGELCVKLVNDNILDKIKYDVKNNRISIEDISLEKQNLRILVKKQEEPENEMLDVKRTTIILKNIKTNSVITLKENQYKFKFDNEIILYLKEVFFDSNIFKNGQRWKIYIKKYYEDIVEVNELVKPSAWVAPSIERHMKPINLDNGINVISYISGKNEVAFLIGDIDIYSREVYKKTSGFTEINNICVQKKAISFDIIDFNKDIVNEVSLILIERKTKKKWTQVIDIDEITSSGKINIDLKNFIKDNIDSNSRWDTFIEIIYGDLINLNKVGMFKSSILPAYSRYLEPIHSKEKKSVVPYLTMKNELSFVINNETTIANEKIKSKISLESFSMEKNIIKGEVALELVECNTFEVDSVIVKHRSKVSDKSYKIPTQVKRINENKATVKFVLDVLKYEFEQFYWDFFVVIEVDNKKYSIKVKNSNVDIKKEIDEKVVRFSYTYDNGYLIYPYITKVGTLAIDYRKKERYEGLGYKIKENLAYYTYLLFKNYFDKKDIWIAYEKFAEGAQDNGFYFFDYCYKNNKKKNFYYVIKSTSPDYENIRSMKDKVIEFMSFKYMLYMYASKLLISSESKGHCYDIRIQKGKIRKYLTDKKHVFLQHGVTALKRVDYVFNKNTANAVDLFVATSDYEKNIIINNFGYESNEIITTGFCRWDVLKDKSGDNKQIFLMPTWRVWMDDFEEEKFIQSEYYKKYVGLLNSERLKNILEEKNITFSFYIHPKFKSYIDRFDTKCKNIKIYQYGEEKVNDLLMKSSMLITDYSSVAWDMYYQKKPVLFYQFDIDDYNKYQGSYLDMETELFGDRLFEVEDLVDTIKEYIDRDFNEKDQYAELRKKYFKYVDTNNCERTYYEIISKKDMLFPKSDKKKKSLKQRLRKNKIVKKIWSKVKKNKKIKNIVKRIMKNIK